MAYNIVLFEPEIPNNTGNIGRLSLASGCNLHLVKPFGFELDDSKLKRAGLDYWKYISLKVYDGIDQFYNLNANNKMVYFSSHGKNDYRNINYHDELFFIFGKESNGLPKHILRKERNNLYKIPMLSNHVRSLNLANSVAIVVYEGLRYLR